MKERIAIMLTEMIGKLRGRTALVGTVSGVLAGIVSAMIGSWTAALEVLCIGLLMDYVSGLIVAGVFHKSPKSQGGALESKAALKGLMRKMLVLFMVVVMHQLDRLTGKTFFRDGACWAFFTVELISITENVGLVYPLPAFIGKAVDWLRNKNDGLTDVIPDGKDTAEAKTKPPNEQAAGSREKATEDEETKE